MIDSPTVTQADPLDCPCCDSTAQLLPHATPASTRYFVQCACCGLRTMHYADEAEAIAAWNTRASAPAALSPTTQPDNGEGQ